MKRRHFLNTATTGLALLPLSSTLLAADADYIIQGGRVLDPGSQTNAMLDIAIKDGVIAAIGRDLDTSAGNIINAEGLLVVPGLIDIHVHARDAELPPAENLADGVTTLVDAGSRGAANIDQMITIASNAPNRVRMLLNIGMYGNNPGGRSEFLDGIAPGDVSRARAAISEHRQFIVGVKARLSRGVAAEQDKQVLRRAILAAEPSSLPVMIHIGDTATPLPQLLSLLRPGDIVTHMYAPTPNGILDADGRLLNEVRQARQRGIRFDFGNGLNEHWAWDIAEKALAQDFPPDTISSDLNIPGRTAQVFNLPTVLSKFLAMGMSLTEVLACVTSNAAQTFAEFNELGKLQAGSVADITLLELRQGSPEEFEFVDNYKGVRQGAEKLFTQGVLMAGVPYL